MLIRSATPEDLPAILAIYNEVIANSTAVYALDPVSLESRVQWFNDRTAQGFPVLVAEDQHEVVGFSSFGEWRAAWPGFRFTVEHSVHVRADQRGKGVGVQLVEALFPLARDKGMHVMLGGIDADNAGSVRFHERLGFEEVARFPEVGHKFGRWLNLVFMQKFLDEPGAARD
ncbi:GNAT family N-acetyltransferase [Pokkaliibacter sp. CJK22405]|uniref:GNAT family N-acetyltransferase n=1 Tax=Pokkaliibacter sp. CJK22405 TaxID=3384615 RepID=UPI0039846D31